MYSAFEQSGGRRAFNTWLNQFISITTQFQFQDTGAFHHITHSAPSAVAHPQPNPAINLLPPKRRHDVVLLLQTSFVSE